MVFDFWVPSSLVESTAARPSKKKKCRGRRLNAASRYSYKRISARKYTGKCVCFFACNKIACMNKFKYINLLVRYTEYIKKITGEIYSNFLIKVSAFIMLHRIIAPCCSYFLLVSDSFHVVIHNTDALHTISGRLPFPFIIMQATSFLLNYKQFVITISSL